MKKEIRSKRSRMIKMPGPKLCRYNKAGSKESNHFILSKYILSVSAIKSTKRFVENAWVPLDQANVYAGLSHVKVLLWSNYHWTTLEIYHSFAGKKRLKFFSREKRSFHSKYFVKMSGGGFWLTYRDRKH